MTTPTPSSSQALLKRSANSTLMAPPPPPKRIKRPATVLEEETYLKALSHIIKRDFFPGLLETEAQHEFLDALESGDKQWIGEAAERVDVAMTPRAGRLKTPGLRHGFSGAWDGQKAGETPQGWVGDTPRLQGRTPMVGSGESSPGEHIDLNMSLSAFQSKYTTEDAESFNSLLDKQNIKRRDKNAWLWTKLSKLPSKQQLAIAAQEQKALEGPAASMALTLSSKSSLQDGVKAPKDDRPAMPDFKQSAPRNALMFNPESIEDTHMTVAQKQEMDSLAPPKAVRYDNTRIMSLAASESIVPPSPSLSAINAALAGRPKPTESELGYSGAATPRVNGYAFVDAEPTEAEMRATTIPEPDTSAILTRIRASAGMSDEANSSDIGMAGGERKGGFKLSEASDREKLHHRMVDKVQKANRVSALGGRVAELYGQDTPGRTPTPKFLSAQGKVPLTPAGASLLRTMHTPMTGKQSMLGSSGFDSASRGSGGKKDVRLPGVTPRRK